MASAVAQSGIKLQADFEVAAGQSADLLLDSDPCQPKLFETVPLFDQLGHTR